MKITFSPVSRVSGLLSIDLYVNPAGWVTEANVSGEQFRGFEAMLRGRRLPDCVYFTQRICGICSMAHGFTAARLVERICGVKPDPEALLLQQAMLGAEFLQNHIRHFYLLALPDYLDTEMRVVPGAGLPYLAGAAPEHSRLSPTRQQSYLDHTFAAVAASRKCHEMLAVFGGKIPHQHGLTAGGVTVCPDADRRKQFMALHQQVTEFIHHIMLPDVSYLAETYPECAYTGAGPGRFLSYGLFDPGLGGHFPSGLWVNDGARTRFQPLQPEEISESIAFAWFTADSAVTGELDPAGSVPDPEKPDSTKPEPLKPAPGKPGAYTWVKAARYQGLAFEGGPLARQIIRNHTNGNRIIGPAGTTARLQARATEAALIAGWIREWMERLPPKGRYFTPPVQPVLATAFQANDAPRGPLLHAASVSGETIAAYQIITPSTWNFAPKDETGERGPAETALIGAKATPDNMTEPGRIIRSFDPCISCATHLMDLRGEHKMTVQILV